MRSTSRGFTGRGLGQGNRTCPLHRKCTGPARKIPPMRYGKLRANRWHASGADRGDVLRGSDVFWNVSPGNLWSKGFRRLALTRHPTGRYAFRFKGDFLGWSAPQMGGVPHGSGLYTASRNDICGVKTVRKPAWLLNSLPSFPSFIRGFDSLHPLHSSSRREAMTPDWNDQGVLPPLRPCLPGSSQCNFLKLPHDSK
ncbi:hypothetical protein DUPY_29290 [Duganella phyllosphaerae]|uniref:Uncharacterized protein n=1 Tax=Duganella phyllosphaerae TaxID=762836 RepID=A0A1E7WJG7_9BURK|nr:hypothetical protein DUPY_29290 [Duganella phyllosphaerae]